MHERKSIFTIAIIALITSVCVYLISQLRFDYDFEAFFPTDNSETDYYQEFRKTFETDNDFFFVALANKEGIFEKEFLLKADSLANDLKIIPYMVEVLSPTQLTDVVRDPFIGSVFKRPMLRINTPENYRADSTTIYSLPGLVGVFFSEDGKSLAINMKHEQRLSKVKSDLVSFEIEKCVNKYHFDETHIIGRALGQRLYVEMMFKELLMFVSISLLLTILFLYVAFRSGWGVLIPTLVVCISITWTLGFMKLIGKDIDLMLTVLPTIIFVVGMSDSVHVLTKYMQELRSGKEKKQAILDAFKSIRLATFLTAFTTAIGFITLVFSNIKPVSDFGIYTSVGVMLAYGLTFTMLPALLILAKPKRLYQFAMSDDFWTHRLHWFFRWLLRKRKWVFISGMVVVAISFYGICRIEVNNMMLEDLRDSHILKKEFRFMENNFSGCRPFEAGVSIEEGVDVFEPEMLDRLDRIDLFLENEYHVGSLYSLPTLIKSINKTFNGGQVEFYRIPTEQKDLDRIKKFIGRSEVRSASSLCYSSKKNVLRISGKVADTGRQHYDSLNTKLQQLVQSLNRGEKKLKLQVTGTAHLIDLNNRLLVENLVLDLLLSISVIGLVMGMVYKSWKMIFLTIIPNIIPLIIVAGIMGFTGIQIKISTSIIFNIAFGIAVDDTIHFLARTRTFLGEGKSVRYAVKRTFLTTGKAMIVTTLILSGGFLTLLFSDFMGTFYIGFLISLTLFIAIIAEMLLTPLIVLYFYKK